MMRLHWERGNRFSHALDPGLFLIGHAAEAAQAGQDALDFGEEYRFDRTLAEAARKQLEVVLPRHLYRIDQGVIFGDLLADIANYTTATEAIVRAALSPAIECRELVVTSPKNERRTKGSTVQVKDLIRPAPQRALFPVVQTTIVAPKP